mmetsp:Transcript_76035/g.131739  ORF Transcript_76035/g.131739 Transcript_76035/m.131739 type:complete len:173 (+) Transcript_76035:32-550(+)
MCCIRISDTEPRVLPRMLRSPELSKCLLLSFTIFLDSISQNAAVQTEIGSLLTEQVAPALTAGNCTGNLTAELHPLKWRHTIPQAMLNIVEEMESEQWNQKEAEVEAERSPPKEDSKKVDWHGHNGPSPEDPLLGDARTVTEPCRRSSTMVAALIGFALLQTGLRKAVIISM